jgi:hypothetical protein
MNKQIKKYFDYKFENGELDSKPYDGNKKWTGIWVDNFLIVGYPEFDDSGVWFTNGPYFMSGTVMFDISPREFNREMEEYIKQNYLDVYISEIY